MGYILPLYHEQYRHDVLVQHEKDNVYAPVKPVAKAPKIIKQTLKKEQDQKQPNDYRSRNYNKAVQSSDLQMQIDEIVSTITGKGFYINERV